MTQDTALKILQTGANVFLTGEPGSGKTYTINKYIAWLREHGVEPAITASTGIASTHIGGMTIHSWSGIGVRSHLSDYDLDAIATTERIVKRIKKTSVLVIDEISMLSKDTLAMVDQVCRTVKNNQMSFGGMQVVVVGDFFQLPPIVSRTSSYNGDAPMLDFDPEESQSPFAFNSRTWREMQPLVCYLSEQHRQSDPHLTEILVRIRKGDYTRETRKALESRMIEKGARPEEIPMLYTHNIDVDRINEERLRAIAGKEVVHKMKSRGPEGMLSGLKRGCLSPEFLKLKIGARVMFTKNAINGAFVNGTLGVVDRFDSANMPIVKTDDGETIHVQQADWNIADGEKVLATIEQLPLRLAWAVTVHKSQGMTLDSALIDLSRSFEYGQGYVAISRVRHLPGLHLIGWNERALQVHPEVKEIDPHFREYSQTAWDMFESMSPEKHDKMKRNFITASGGTPEGGVVFEKKRGGLEPKKDTKEETLLLVKQGKNIAEIASVRDLTVGTICGHACDLFEAGKLGREDLLAIASPHLTMSLTEVHRAMHEKKSTALKPFFELFGGRYSYDDLRIARLLLEEVEQSQEEDAY